MPTEPQDATYPSIFSGETRHGVVQVQVHPTDAAVEIWRGGTCVTRFNCTLNELLTLCGVGAQAYSHRIPYFTKEDQDDFHRPRRSFKLGQIAHASRAKDERLINRVVNEEARTD